MLGSEAVQFYWPACGGWITISQLSWCSLTQLIKHLWKPVLKLSISFTSGCVIVVYTCIDTLLITLMPSLVHYCGPSGRGWSHPQWIPACQTKSMQMGAVGIRHCQETKRKVGPTHGPTKSNCSSATKENHIIMSKDSSAFGYYINFFLIKPLLWRPGGIAYLSNIKEETEKLRQNAEAEK